MAKLSVVKPRELIRFLEQNGFVLDHVTGSHHIFYNPTTKRRAVVVKHNREIPKGTLFREAGFSREGLRQFIQDR